MENLFNFATKELSQDAFLLWLFASYRDEEYGHIGKELLAEFVNLVKSDHIKPEQITNIVAHSKPEDIDIVVDFKVNDRDYILAIEDKTTSSHHDDQLKRYKETIKKWNEQKNDIDRPTFLIYYKTHKMDKQEISEVENKYGWKNYPFEMINDFWKKYTKCGNMIIEQYAEHIVGSYKNSNNTSFPNDHNIDKWIGYFENLQKHLSIKCNVEVGEYQSRYAYLKVRPCGFEKNKIPYLEIRSRDCLNKDNNKVLNAHILLYGVDLKKEEKEAYKARIKTPFHNENNKQQIGSMLKRNQIAQEFKTEEEYEDKLKEVIKAYLSFFDK